MLETLIPEFLKSNNNEILIGSKFIEGISVKEALQIHECVKMEIKKHSRVEK